MANISKYINIALRGLEFLWSLLIIALVGNMIASSYNGNNPSIVNYSMFVAVISMLSLFYLIPATIRESWAIHPIIMVVVDLLNTIFYFCGAIALASYLHVHSCGNTDYVNNNSITRGSPDKGKRCHEAQATCAFLWFGFVAFAASTVLSGLQSRGGANTRSGGIRRSGPAMSQV